MMSENGTNGMGSGRTEPFLRKVRIRNYKSIGKCDVSLARLTVLVGRNGAGKSNFLDALRFVVDGLESSLDHAMKSRGGIEMVRRKSTGHPRNFAIQVEFNLPEMRVAKYGFEVAARPKGGFSVRNEVLEITNARYEKEAYYRVADGELIASSPGVLPKVAPDRLFLVVASGVPEFRAAYDALTSMGFYNFNPDVMKELQSPDAGELLHRDGDNIASVIARIEAEAPAEKERIELYLSKIVAGIEGVRRAQFGPRETIEFMQRVEGAKHPWSFPAANISDGTLRALGILIAVSQLVHLKDRVRLVGIEEPETALHPAAAQALMDALMEAKEHTQIVFTTHSADLLDRMEFDPEELLAVESKLGETWIGRIDTAGNHAIRNHLFSAGELLRMDQLEPDPVHLQQQEDKPLFDFAGPVT